MRIITKKTIEEYYKEYPTTKASLQRWIELAEEADWKDISDLRISFRDADPVTVKSGRIVTVFNISGNNFRLITAIHYNKGIVFTLNFLTHAEYSKDKWKDVL